MTDAAYGTARRHTARRLDVVAAVPEGVLQVARWQEAPAAEAAAVQGWLMSGADERPTLVLAGAVGVGKTCLAALAAAWLLDQLVPVRWTPAGALFEALHGAEPVDRAAYASAGVLVIDDLGAEVEPSGYGRPRFEALVDWRVTARLPLLITTNVRSLSFMRDRYGAPTYSRLCSKASTALVRFTSTVDRRTEEELWRG